MTHKRHAMLCLIAVCLLLKYSAGLKSIRTEKSLVNVAQDKNIDLGDTPGSNQFILDGNSETCIEIHTGNDVWWRVDLGDLYTIFDIRIKPTRSYFEQKRVAAILRRENSHMTDVHCVAHRLALCTSQAAAGISHMQKHQQILTDMIYYFKIATDQFISTTYILMDAMAPVTILSQFFQTENVDVALVKVKLDLCVQDLEKVKAMESPYCLQLKQDLQGDIFRDQHHVTSTNFDLIREKDECYDNLRTYQGQVNTTISGYTCQRWDKQIPHKHGYHQENFWYRGDNYLAENYCRTPDHDYDNPWCYTTNKTVRREQCDVKLKECTNVLYKKTSFKIGDHSNAMKNIDYVQVEEVELSYWKFILPYRNATRFVEFSQNGTSGIFNLCEVEIYGTKGAIFNVAYNKTTSSSALPTNTRIVVDEVMQEKEHCFLVPFRPKRWFKVDLGDTFVISLVRIHTYYDDTNVEREPVFNYELVFWKDRYDVVELFVRATNTSDSFMIDIVARFLEITLIDGIVFTLCELQLYGTKAVCPYNPCKNGGQCFLQTCDESSDCADFYCQCPLGYAGDLCEDCVLNVALKKDVLVSSLYYQTWLPSNVNDGDVNQYVGIGATCVATKREIKPYLIVDLGADYILSGVKVYKQLDQYPEEQTSDVELLLMENIWTSYGYFLEDNTKILLKPYVETRLVRLQITETTETETTKETKEIPVVLRICEVEVFAVCQDGEDSAHVKHSQSKPYMQMRFALSNKYSDVVREEGAFIYSIKEEISIVTNYSTTSFQNMKVEKDPFRVAFELHSTDGNLRTLSNMLETIDILCKRGLDMTTEDGNNLTIIADSLQYHVMYSGTSGAMLWSRILVTVSIIFNMVSYL